MIKNAFLLFLVIFYSFKSHSLECSSFFKSNLFILEKVALNSYKVKLQNMLNDELKTFSDQIGEKFYNRHLFQLHKIVRFYKNRNPEDQLKSEVKTLVQLKDDLSKIPQFRNLTPEQMNSFSYRVLRTPHIEATLILEILNADTSFHYVGDLDHAIETIQDYLDILSEFQGIHYELSYFSKHNSLNTIQTSQQLEKLYFETHKLAKTLLIHEEINDLWLQYAEQARQSSPDQLLAVQAALEKIFDTYVVFQNIPPEGRRYMSTNLRNVYSHIHISRQLRPYFILANEVTKMDEVLKYLDTLEALQKAFQTLKKSEQLKRAISTL